jgi:hypothetical protein
MKVYAWCAEEQRASFNWLFFADLDEFLHVQSGCAPSAHARTSPARMFADSRAFGQDCSCLQAG